MKRILLIFTLLLTLTAATQAQVKRPKIVVGIVVDQMRWDYLYYYYDEYCSGGLKRLLREGFSCENNMINYIPTVTAIGHTSIYTGTVPSLHGIAGNTFYQNGKKVYCCEDSTVTPIGSNGKAGLMSPRNCYATTIGDMLKVATDFKSKVIGVALKDRAAILPAGHSADAAYWYDIEAGHFITSSYYMNKLPKWMEKYNEKHGTTPGKDIRYKPSAITLTFDMAKAILENEKMGEGKETDMLCVSISSTDLIGHTYGTRGKENHAAYIQLDNDLADFFTLLDQRYGRYGYLLFLSADHGAVHNPNFLEHNKIPTGSFSTSETAKALNTAMKKHFNISEALISQVTTCQLYLNNDAIQRSNLKRHDVVQFIKQEVIKNKHVAYVVDPQHAATEPIPALLRERAINGYNNKRSGDILIIPQANVYPTNYKSDFKGTTHGLWNPYDAHIPLIFMGWNVQHGATARITNITDIAATVCAMLHIQMPDACIGEPIKEIVK